MAKPGQLTERQRRFVREYIACGNATLAAERAGYKHPNKQGPPLVKLGHVAEAIAKSAAKADERAWMSREERLKLLNRIALGLEMEQALTLSGDPVPSPAKLRDRLKAIELQGRMEGDFVEKREVTGKDGGAIEVSTADGAELARRAMAQIAKGGG
jgi:phage terminase small subunit